MNNSLMIFLMMLPLLDEKSIVDFLHRTCGHTDSAYIAMKLEDLWNSIPDSPSKHHLINSVYFHARTPAISEICSDEIALSEINRRKKELFEKHSLSLKAYEEEHAYLMRLKHFRTRFASQG